ncbi:MAG TPA: AbrB/MazE/SpoVT family DNA-binding domain-containing protein [Phycisphaerae bacterium]|nr:AbrB/MazE/SpoVT family DNA-binding domain-containing protein [Phycisphaerae bacterium]HRY71257.1 AbrB/MazE/SpoVT family DNA-binding domain-containing protein [Phycisphaerae bacterium]HSA29663.1 AbrB/MazE/SpoVT family DNA-binding domain-containing protein [Phycisphaerae bacterium]
MMRTTCDGKGRIYLEESVRAKYGESFLVLEGRRELILRPIPRDPMQDLREIGRKLEGYSIEALKRMVDEQADKEVSETLERLGLKRIPLESEPGRSATAAAGGPR